MHASNLISAHIFQYWLAEITNDIGCALTRLMCLSVRITHSHCRRVRRVNRGRATGVDEEAPIFLGHHVKDRSST